jgi:choline dehydrogenase-like flavoprotein
MGGNPLSADRSIGAVDANFAVYDFDNLFVTDASVFPSSVTVNPMDTVMALADYAAPRILARA